MKLTRLRNLQLRHGLRMLLLAGAAGIACWPAAARADNAAPPQQGVKLVFIHHSCGENWLADAHGGLGRALADNNYFVSDTNYGWGPDGIGDRTDITDWPEWFTGDRSRVYLQALYRESGVHSPYRRKRADPGGENRVIMFKSCFPNSALAGHPGDRPRRGSGLTVANAKAIYNELLKYFATRPDKLFVVVTAPPLLDGTHAANARAFNTWLVRDWLSGYPAGNVAVFDFFNVLTAPGNHHRFRNGQIEYINNRGGDTLYYPTNGDNHPAPSGNRKAAAEFVGLLNVFYHRWRAQNPEASAGVSIAAAEAQTDAPGTTSAEAAAAQAPPPLPAASPQGPAAAPGTTIDDFENGVADWSAFIDTSRNTRLKISQDTTRCHAGQASLHIRYAVAPQSWATCSLVFDSARDWSATGGVSLWLRAAEPGQSVVVVAYGGRSPDRLVHFEYRLKADQGAVGGWRRVTIPWSAFSQPEWQGDPAVAFDPRGAMGMAFAFSGTEALEAAGDLWVDDIAFVAE